MKNTLYSYYRSSSAYRVRIALYYLKVPFEYRAIHLLHKGGEQHSLEFNRINPMEQVPALVVDDRVITQSMAIFSFLNEAYGKTKPLFPEDRVDWVRCIELCEIINSGIQPVQNLSVLQRLKQDFGLSEEQKKAWNQHWIIKGLRSFESLIKDDHRGFSVGRKLSAADMFLIPQLYNANRFEVTLDEFPKIKAIQDNCLSLECFQKAHPDQQPDRP